MLQLYHYPFKTSLRAISKIDSAFEYAQNPTIEEIPPTIAGWRDPSGGLPFFT